MAISSYRAARKRYAGVRAKKAAAKGPLGNRVLRGAMKAYLNPAVNARTYKIQAVYGKKVANAYVKSEVNYFAPKKSGSGSGVIKTVRSAAVKSDKAYAARTGKVTKAYGRQVIKRDAVARGGVVALKKGGGAIRSL